MISFGRKLALFKCRWRPKYFISISELFIGEPNFFNFIHLRHFILFGDHTVFIGGLRMFNVYCTDIQHFYWRPPNCQWDTDIFIGD